MGEDEKVCVRLAKDDPKKDIGRLGTVCLYVCVGVCRCVCV